MANSINWIGIDDHADKLTIAHYIGNQKQAAKEWEVIPTEHGLRQLVRWLKSLAGQLRCVYEAGPCGYELYRLLINKGIDCAVAAPSLTPQKPGERIKTNRRDARKLAQMHRAGMLTLIHVPDRRHESVRDLLRARDAARRNLLAARHRLSKFLLRHGYRFREGTAWRSKHWQWIRSIMMPEPYEQIVVGEYIASLEQRQTEIRRLDEIIAIAAQEPDYAPLVAQLCALRGIDVLTAMVILSELGDLRRFPSAGQLMAADGLVPREYSTGNKTRRFGITGHRECACPPRPGAGSLALPARAAPQRPHSSTPIQPSRAAAEDRQDCRSPTASQVSPPDQPRKTLHHRHHCRRPRTRRLRQGRRSATALIPS